VKSQEIVSKSCSLFQDVSCYDIFKDFSGPIIAVLIAFFSIRFAFAQLDKQHQNTLDAQKEESKRNTKIELFKDINLLLDNVSSIVREVNTFCLARQHPAPGTPIELSQTDYEAFSAKLNHGLLAVISKVESHEIINQKLFKAFRYSLEAIVYDISDLRFSDDRRLVLDSMHELGSDASCYLYDFQICMQNLAYGDVFDHKLSARVPVDKTLKVITADSDSLDALLNHFSNETNWGKSWKSYENEAKEKCS